MSDGVFLPPRFKPGDELTAAYRNSRNAAIKRAGRLSGSTGIVVSDRSLALVLPECTDIKLTTSANGDGGYGAKEVLESSLGTWADSGRTMPQGSDPAYERNHNVSLTAGDRVYRACRGESTDEWIFAHRGTPTDDPPPPPPIAWCGCSIASSDGSLVFTCDQGTTPLFYGPIHGFWAGMFYTGAVDGLGNPIYTGVKVSCAGSFLYAEVYLNSGIGSIPADHAKWPFYVSSMVGNPYNATTCLFTCPPLVAGGTSFNPTVGTISIIEM